MGKVKKKRLSQGKGKKGTVVGGEGGFKKRRRDGERDNKKVGTGIYAAPLKKGTTSERRGGTRGTAAVRSGGVVRVRECGAICMRVGLRQSSGSWGKKPHLRGGGGGVTKQGKHGWNTQVRGEKLRLWDIRGPRAEKRKAAGNGGGWRRGGPRNLRTIFREKRYLHTENRRGFGWRPELEKEYLGGGNNRLLGRRGWEKERRKSK